MSKSIEKAGGSAFPLNEDRFPDGKLKSERNEGMSLRDYFIAHIGDENQGDADADYGPWVKEAVVGRKRPNGTTDGWLAVLEFEAEFRAKWRVMRADAMLKAREEQE